MKVNNEKRKKEFTTIICPRCENPLTSKLCNACGLCLGKRMTMSINEVRAKADRLMNELIKCSA